MKTIILKVVLVILVLFSGIVLSREDRETSEFFLDEKFWIYDDSDFHAQITKNQKTIKNWIDDLNNSDTELVFLGETHFDSYRQFLAEKVFPYLYADILFLECDPDEISEILAKIESGQKANLLGADISSVINSARKANPTIRIIGIAPTEAQKRQVTLNHSQGKTRFSRDGFVAQNLMDSFKKGKKHVVLYGANHGFLDSVGLNGDVGFFRILKNLYGKKISMTNAYLEKQKSYGGCILASFMELLKMADETFVIPDTALIEPRFYNYNWEIKKYFQNYKVIVFFT